MAIKIDLIGCSVGVIDNKTQNGSDGKTVVVQDVQSGIVVTFQLMGDGPRQIAAALEDREFVEIASEVPVDAARAMSALRNGHG